MYSVMPVGGAGMRPRRSIDVIVAPLRFLRFRGSVDLAPPVSSDLGPVDLAAAFGAFSPLVARAWQASFLAALPASIAVRLLTQARQGTVPAVEIFYRGAYHEEMGMLALVAEGRLR